MFRQDFTCPALLKDFCSHYVYGAVTHFSHPFQSVPLVSQKPLAWSAFARHYYGVSFDVLSSGYLDVSVPRVRF